MEKGLAALMKTEDRISREETPHHTNSAFTLNRRTLLQTPVAVALSAGLGHAADRKKIQRERLVRRHNPILRNPDPFSPFSVGNGEFAFTADISGLQSFPEAYASAIPLCTQSNWGWHSFPLPAGVRKEDFRMTPYDTYGRAVGYPIKADGQEQLYRWLRENPHRLNLGRIGFRYRKTDGAIARMEDLREMEQTLDLWTGVLSSRYRIEGTPVEVRTCCHPGEDAIAVEIHTAMLSGGKIELCLSFPYGSPAIDGCDWKQPDRHTTTIEAQEKNRIRLFRQLDADHYALELCWEGDSEWQKKEPHSFTLIPKGTADSGFRFLCRFSSGPHRGQSLSPQRVFADSDKHWQQFWSEGGAVDLEGSTHPQAEELERRIVLSQYLTAIQCCGSLPPQETGLTCNSWNGKYHLEMHWWHAAHFAQWNRHPLLHRSLEWYRTILPEARRTAERQGYAGARWPKMTGPNGVDSPSPIGPLLIWQQPHPIYYAELCRQADASGKTLQQLKDIVFASAEFMASYAFHQKEKDRYVLGPPVIPAQENHDPKTTWNPTYELVYWRWGLETAQTWRRLLGMEMHAGWARVQQKLSALPIGDGLYLAHENCPDTFTAKNSDHPSMLGALGVLPGKEKEVDRTVMKNTLHRVMQDWKWETSWGWDFPMTAMTAARLQEPEIAVQALLLESPKNRYLPNGHNYQRPNLPLYLPGNGGLLSAVAMMAAGWQGNPDRDAPGFPKKKGWKVRWEDLLPML